MCQSHRLINIVCRTFLLPPRRLECGGSGGQREISARQLLPQCCSCSTVVCVCVHVSVPASQRSDAFPPVSSRCVLSYQACQTLTFRRCLLLDSIARLPKPEGKCHFPSPSASLSQSRSPSAVSSCHLQRRPSSHSAAHGRDLTFWISSLLKA